MNLDSDATLEYVLKTGSLHLTEEQLATPSGYNRSIRHSLPERAVSCNVAIVFRKRFCKYQRAAVGIHKAEIKVIIRNVFRVGIECSLEPQ